MGDTKREVNRVLLITLFLNLLVAFGKIVTGMLTGALAITADGFHSLADGASNLVGLVGNRVAGNPPDQNHPYGHQRFETLAALGIGVLLLFTAWEMLGGVIARLTGHGELPDTTPLSFGVMIATLLINTGVNRYQVGQAKRLKSEILLADAANTGSDIFVTLAVLVSMVLITAFGWYWADTVTALIVVVLIGRAAWEIMHRTGSVLVDTAPLTPEQLTGLVLQNSAVTGVVRARSRGAKDAAIIDLDLQIAPETTAERSASVRDAVEENLRTKLPGVLEVNIQFVPAEPEQRDYRVLVPITAEALGLAAHHVYLNQTSDGDVLELHVEVPASKTLNEAHELASQLETALQRRLPELADVVTHIEPAPVEAGNGLHVECSLEKIAGAVVPLLQNHYPDIDWHDLQVFEQARGAGITLHASLAPEITIEQAHDLAAAAERLLRNEISGLDRVTIHTEPESQ